MIDSWDGPPEPTGPVIRRSHYDLPWMLLPTPVQLPVAPPAALRSPPLCLPGPLQSAWTAAANCSGYR